MIELRKTSDSAEDASRRRILETLDAHSQAAGHPFRPQTIVLEAWERDDYLGGILARSVSDWTYIELLAVTDAARGRGVGRMLVEAVEREARRLGNVGLWLDTFTYQAPGFYQKLGFSEFGRIEDHPRGRDRVFLLKRIV
jgi:GNAT superfamily N-acetyltransferase